MFSTRAAPYSSSITRHRATDARDMKQARVGRQLGVSMNAISGQASVGSHTFLDLVDFKWLMAGRGWWVDLSRLQRDVTYAGECLQRGLSSGSELLRQRSVELMPLCQ